MCRTTLVWMLVVVLAVGSWLAPAAAQAHGGPPRLELSADQLYPGAALEVRGVNIAPDLPVMVTLVGAAGAEFPLGAATGDAHGDFIQLFSLPVELAAGAYTAQVVTSDRMLVGARLTIIGTAAPAAEEGEGQRDHDEPLLVPGPFR